MKDYLIKATAYDGKIRAVGGITTEMVKCSYDIHKTSPTASVALGRTLTAASLMSSFLKGENNVLTIQIKGSGPLGSIVVISDSKASVRGLVGNPMVDAMLDYRDGINVKKAIGKNGYLNVIMDLGLKEPYVSLVDLVSGEIGEDIAYYYAYSEQIPTVVALGVLIDTNGEPVASGGFIIQLLSGGEIEIVEEIEKRISNLEPISNLIKNGMSMEDILSEILGKDKIKFNDRYHCNLKCNCSRDRMERNLISLGKEELEKIIDDNNGAELNCHFCQTKYMFENEDLIFLHELIKKREN